MIAIPLSTQGTKNKGKYEASIDEEDFDIVNRHRWTAMPSKNTVYAVRFDGDKCITMHRYIMGIDDRMGWVVVVDHLDGNGLNNCKSNLSIVSHTENLYNSYKRQNNRSGFKGVSMSPSGDYAVSIHSRSSEKRITLGKFSDPVEAAQIYDCFIVSMKYANAKTNFNRELYTEEYIQKLLSGIIDRYIRKIDILTSKRDALDRRISKETQYMGVIREFMG